MRFIIEARIVDEASSSEPMLLGEIDRPDAELDPVTFGLTLAEGGAAWCAMHSRPW